MTLLYAESKTTVSYIQSSFALFYLVEAFHAQISPTVNEFTGTRNHAHNKSTSAVYRNETQINA